MTTNSLFSRIRQRISRRTQSPIADTVPRITNDSVAEHREEVLGRARKFIYPLRHSRTRVVKLSVSVVITAAILFLAGSMLALYRFQSTSSFLYGVTRVIPFPVAWADGRFVSYESYLFELRHYMYYYQHQQDVNFQTDSGRRQLAALKQRSLNQAINRAYVAKLAHQHRVSVSSQEVSQQVDIARQQNRLGASDAVFKSVLQEFWGWTPDDFRHELALELRDQKVAAALDTKNVDRAKQAYQQLQQGADFGKLAAKVSDDLATAKNGGKYDFTITPSNRDLPPQLVQEIFTLKKGQFSPVIDTGYTLEIVKVLDVNGQKRQAAHMAFNYHDISTYVTPLRKEHPAKVFIHQQ